MNQSRKRARAELLTPLIAILVLLLQSDATHKRVMTAAAEAAPRTSRAAETKVLVTAVRFTASDGYARITVELSQEARFEVQQLPDDSGKGMPRVYVDIFGARLALASKQPVQADEKLVRQVRIGQYSANIVRVVLDVQNRTAHNAFMVSGPHRLIIDIAGEKTAERSYKAASRVNEVAARGRQPIDKTPASRSVSNGLRKVVLDPGHGGKDPGASGSGGIAEKDIVLGIAKKLALKLKTEMGTEVVLTRKDDRFVPLEDRTLLANSEDADLFISLHVNASPNIDAKGIETYYLDNTTDEAAIRLAARENATSRKNISDLQFILSDMMQNMKLEDSITLAHRLQSSLVSGMSKFMGDVKDLGVKKALFHVLVGARMPSVLVEMFFITNKTESRVMADAGYQDAMVNALFEGIQKYAQSNLVAKTL
ncbi:MAG TPA: N-acetylmuramoyl-L-alanine amidase [Candidatus Binatia bacterium]